MHLINMLLDANSNDLDLFEEEDTIPGDIKALKKLAKEDDGVKKLEDLLLQLRHPDFELQAESDLPAPDGVQHVEHSGEAVDIDDMSDVEEEDTNQ